MHVIALAWDVDRPGWLDPSLLALAGALEGAGATCELVTLGTGPTSTRRVEGVEVTWVAEAPPVLPATPDYDIARVLAAATRASGAAERRCQRAQPDVVLAVGWQTAYTATTLRASRGIPIVASLDSTAPGRAREGLDETGRLAAQIEWWLTYEARRVVASSVQVRRELRDAFRLPASKIDVIPPGMRVPTEGGDRDHRGGRPEVVVVGPPGVVRAVRRRVPRGHLSVDAADIDRAAVAVVMDDHATALVLRAMAAGRAVVVPDDGHLRGLVHARRSGLRVGRRPAEVADTVEALLQDPARRARLGRQARDRVAARHDWDVIARRHLDVAARAAAEEASLGAVGTPRPLRPQLLRSPLLGLVDETGEPPTNGPHRSKGHG